MITKVKKKKKRVIDFSRNVYCIEDKSMIGEIKVKRITKIQKKKSKYIKVQLQQYNEQVD